MVETADQARDLTGMRVALVHAHPDDEAITTGGTIAQLVRRGAQVTVVTCTLGELGEVIGDPYRGLVGGESDQLGGFRVHELHAALVALGCNGPGHAPVHLGGAGRWRDSGMIGDPGNDDPRAFIGSGDEALGHLADVLGRLRPHVVITYDADGGYGHPDHIRAHEITHAAAGDRDILWTVTPLAEFRAGIDAIDTVPEGWTLPSTGYVENQGVDKHDLVVPLDDAALAAKREAMRAHATQIWFADGSVSTSNPQAAWGHGTHPVWALSNLHAQPLLDAEYYQRGAGTPPEFWA